MRLKFYATVFGIPGELRPDRGPTARVCVRRGAFAELLASGERPPLNVNHDSRWPLAVSRMALWEDAIGLGVLADVADDGNGRALASALLAGRCRGASIWWGSDAVTETRCDPAHGWLYELVQVRRLLDICLVIDRPAGIPATARYVEAWR